MSIFKESFRDFVAKQLLIRQTIISQGNKGDSRFVKKEVDFGNLGGGTVNLPAGAFFTNTINRACVIRLSSGVDLKPGSDILEEGKFEKEKDLIGSGLAKRYILEGGTLINLPKDDKIFTAQRRGFPGTAGKLKSGKQRSWGFSYGDPFIRANASKDPRDGYGIVPMPGITDVEVQTKSAYGSLRTAKVKFVCHNQRQLEVLELLYMRPGYPMLLEWGWSTYINNDGKRSSEFPHIYDFFSQDTTQAIINQKIIENKIKTGGNYDGLLGFCKNFNYKARPDGGYDCNTEMVSAGEIIESIKPPKSIAKFKLSNTSFFSGVTIQGTDEIERMLQKVQDAGAEEKQAEYNAYAIDPETHIPIHADPAGYLARQRKIIGEGIRGPLGMTPDQPLTPLIIPKDSTFENHKDDYWHWDQEFISTFIRWDALIQLFNTWFIPKSEKVSAGGVREPLFTMTTNMTVADDKLDKSLEPLLYTKINNPFQGKIAKLDGDLDILDMSLDPTVCIMPHQMDHIGASINLGKLYITLITFGLPLLFGHPTGGSYAYDYKITKDIEQRQIGMIYLNVDHLLRVHRGMMYNEDRSYKDDYNLFDFITKIWDDVNEACAGQHKFMLSIDHERPNLVRIIDNIYPQELDQSKIITLNIQSNESVVRDFSYHTSIPSAMVATIATAAQNPDDSNDIDQATFAAINKNISNRLSTPPKPKAKEAMPDEEQKILAKQYDQEVQNYQESIKELVEFKKKLVTTNDYQEVEKDGEVEKSKTISDMKNHVRGAIKHSNSILRKHQNTLGKFGPYKGQIDHKKVSMPRSAIIPLKFNATLDGISGIVIGNVFKIPDTRLPRGYKHANIAFITTGENQKITAGQDWTTRITGQMMVLNDKSQSGIDDGFEYNDFNEGAGVNTLKKEEYDWGAHQGPTTVEQNEIPACMEEIKKGTAVYLKEIPDPIHVRSGPKVSNQEMASTDDNIIGTIKTNHGGLYLGEVRKVVNQETIQGFHKKGGSGSLVDEEGNPPDVTKNDTVPWYYVQMDYKDPAMRAAFDIGFSPNRNGKYDYRADDYEMFYSNAANFHNGQWHNERYKTGNYNAGTGGKTNTTDDIGGADGKGNEAKGYAHAYFRIDVLQPLPSPPTDSSNTLLKANYEKNLNNPLNAKCVPGQTT